MSYWNEKTTQWAREFPSKIGIFDEKTSFSFEDIFIINASLRDTFHQCQIFETNRVVVILPRSAELALILASLLNNGIVGLVIDPKLNTSEIKKTLKHVKPVALISNEACFQNLHSEFNFKNKLELNFSLTHPILRPRIYQFDEWGDFDSPETTSWLLNTSGSTSTPKTVMISNENLKRRTQGEMNDFEINESDVLLNYLPFSHDLGLNQLLSAISSGATIFIKSSSVSKLSECLIDLKITGMTATPLLWNDFEKSILAPQIFLGLKYLTVSGGSASEQRLKWLKDLFPKTQIIKTYGQTETFRSLISKRISDLSQGQPISGVRLEIVDTEGKICGKGKTGELIHFGDGCMNGYLFDVTASQDKMIWANDHIMGVRTGDLFSMDIKGDFFFEGRSDDTIKRFEQRFQLSEIENMIKNYSGVIEAAVVPIPTEEKDWRQFILQVYVELRPGAQISEKQILDFCKSELSYYKVPDSVRIIESFPKTSSYKIDRAKLIEIYDPKANQ